MDNYGRLKIFLYVTVLKQKFLDGGFKEDMKRVVIYNKYCQHKQVENLVTNFMENNKSLRFFNTEYEFIIQEGKFFHKITDPE
jgi:hypothetical protein